MNKCSKVIIRLIVLSLLIMVVSGGSNCKLADRPTPESTQISNGEQTQIPDSGQDEDSATTNRSESDEQNSESNSNPDEDQISDSKSNNDDDQTQGSLSEHDNRGPIIANHLSTDISSIPPSWIAQARSDLRILYFRTSHGTQLTTGMTNLQSQYGTVYNYNETGEGGALSYREIWDDLGQQGSLDWVSTTRERLNQPDDDINVVIWSWCGGVSYTSKEGISIYLNAMNQLEIDYPNITFVYMTGHLDGTGEQGNLNIRNNQIRDYCAANSKVLYDFADIESYDPDGSYFLDLNADDSCEYIDGNWAQEWYEEHIESDLSYGISCAHSHVINCNLKGRAFWWLLARIAGWEG